MFKGNFSNLHGENETLKKIHKLFSLETNKSQRKTVDDSEQIVLSVFLTKLLRQTQFFDKSSEISK